MSNKRVKVKPGKTQSKIGFVAGILFVLIGLVVVIPTFGLFGVVWTAFAGIIAFSHYKNGFTDEGFATHEIIIDGTDAEADGEDIEQKLRKLDSLYQQGLITRDEYDSKRKEFLDEF